MASLGRKSPEFWTLKGKFATSPAVVKDIAGDVLGPEGLKHLKGLDLGKLPPVGGRSRGSARRSASVPKFLGIGLNYRDHADETGMPIPEAPIVFAKATSCICGPDDPILMPKDWERMDFEVELAFAIGSGRRMSLRPTRFLRRRLLIADDVSERSLQKGGAGEWIKAKSYDSFGPLGPWLVTKDEVPDPQALDLALDLNGTRMQTGNTSTMIFSVAHLVSYISSFMTLSPATSSPPARHPASAWRGTRACS